MVSGRAAAAHRSRPSLLYHDHYHRDLRVDLLLYLQMLHSSWSGGASGTCDEIGAQTRIFDWWRKVGGA